MVKKVSVVEALDFKNALLLDARTPQEYAEDHILGAINVPLLDDQERHEIGIIYKQYSREKAIERGMELFPAKIPSIYNAVKDHRNKIIIVYCARGGMRSGIIASLLESIGFKVLQVEGGYKSFRQYITDQLHNFKLKPKIICLYGLTCTGKTKLLEQLPNALNLEELAQHRGSLYGGVGLKPNAQKRFENLLLQRLRELNHLQHIFVEGESRRIGKVEIPSFLFKAMKHGMNVVVKRDFELRAAAGVEEYFSSLEKIREIKEITPQLREIISNKRKQEIITLIENGNYQDATRILLKEYYDVLYAHTLKNVRFDFEVDNNDLEKAITKLKEIEKKTI
ncbi:MAG: tRNA 2-selenouridine(34) synthase MnmH [Nanoarchaeota archaeon]|nr:tRNA 2-selenouridine(34) synthase MnmH [Nanoarchaeota archaeon]